MKKTTIFCIFICTTTISNTALGMIIRLRPCRLIAQTGHRKYNGGNKQILQQLTKSTQLLKQLSDNQRKSNLLLEKILKSDNNTIQENHAVDLPEGKHPLISTAKNDFIMY
jgi:hypothetical protein